MANFKTDINIKLFDEASASLTKLQGKFKSFSKGVEGSCNKAASSFSKLEGSMKGLSSFGLNLSAFGIAGGLITANIVKPFLEFDATMSSVAPIFAATGAKLQSLKDQAKALGATSKFSAKEAVSGQELLAQAGFKSNQILTAMPALLNLTAAGHLDLAKASDMSSNVLGGFGLQVSELSKVNDVLANTATSSNKDISILGESLKFAAPSAKALGASIESTSAALGVLGNNGIQGTMAGTGLLSSQVDKLKELEKANNNAGDSAKRMANIMSNNLSGDLKGFQSRLESLRISILEASNSQMRFAVQSGGAMLSFLNDAVTAFPNTTATIFSFTAGLSGAFTTISPVLIALPELVSGLKFLAIGFKGVAVGIRIMSISMMSNPITAILVGVTAAIIAFAAWKNRLSGVASVFKMLFALGKSYLATVLYPMTKFLEAIGKGLSLIGIKNNLGKLDKMRSSMFHNGINDTKTEFHNAFWNNTPAVLNNQNQTYVQVDVHKDGTASTKTKGGKAKVETNTGNLLGAGL